MKKILSIILITVLMFTMVACGQKEDDSSDVPKTQLSPLQESLQILLDNGWEATDNGYVYTESNDYCDQEINARPGISDLDLEIHYDYRDNNETMAASYSEDTTLAASVAAMWTKKILTQTNAEIGTINYIIYVGDTKVADSSMNIIEALDIAAENDD